jgi:hypothetical protein
MHDAQKPSGSRQRSPKSAKQRLRQPSSDSPEPYRPSSTPATRIYFSSLLEQRRSRNLNPGAKRV